MDASRIPSGPFSRAAARRAGLTKDNLRHPSIERIGSDLWALAGSAPTLAEQAAAIAAGSRSAWVSHGCAADLHGIPHEWRIARPEVTAARSRNRVRRVGVECAVDRFGGLGVGELGGVAISRPERVWMEIANAGSRTEAVALADSLVRIPRYGFEGRSEPFCDLQDLLTLARTVRDHALPHRIGHLREPERQSLRARVELLAEFAELVRVGSDSRPETAMRLALLDAGLPEPRLQHEIVIDDRLITVLDAAFVPEKVGVSYDGSPHLTPQSLARDAARNNALATLGWTHFVATRADLRENFRSLTARATAALLRRAG